MLDPAQTRSFVIEPTLKLLARVEPRLDQPAAVELVLGTMIEESTVGGKTFLRQIPNGPARSPFQMEPATHRNHRRWLQRRPDWLAVVDSLLVPGMSAPEQLTWNLAYACAMCRIHYWKVPHALPDVDDVMGMARYWKAHYNTVLGKGRPERWVRTYRRHVLPTR